MESLAADTSRHGEISDLRPRLRHSVRLGRIGLADAVVTDAQETIGSARHGSRQCKLPVTTVA